ncbi:unnamed protein product [Prorocentrum cordatum]|uniref:Ubiquitinyl hydrolase 1 n=1 Tax=Prorocentrum cordatum TaxID=2364126 RepID=A0ABN9UML3_9DINO|nr:unnamed protein product [Polarella glacialis]
MLLIATVVSHRRSDGDASESSSPGCLGSGSSGRRNKEQVQWTPKSRWKMSLGKKEIRISQSHGGRVGLRNMGNSCFMNAGLQDVPEPHRADYRVFPHWQVQGGGQHGQPLRHEGEAGGGLRQAAGGPVAGPENSKTQSPKQLHRAMSDFAPHLFEGREQQEPPRGARGCA